MKSMACVLSVLMVLLLSMGGAWSAMASAIDPYPFQNEAQRAVFKTTIAELRCPKCQNQSVSDSDAPIAHDMRRKVYELVLSGKRQAEIVDFMVARYGDFVTYRPPLRPSTILLWVGPPTLVFVVLLVFFLRHRGRVVSPAGGIDQAELDRILHQYGGDAVSVDPDAVATDNPSKR